MATSIVSGEVNKVNVLTDRVKQRREECVAAREHVCTGRSRLVTESWKETEGQPVMMRRARLFKKVMEGNPIIIRDGELIAGSQTRHVRGSSPYVDYTTEGAIQLLALEKPKARGVIVEAVFAEEDRQRLIEDVQYWQGRAPADVVKKVLQEVLPADIDDYEAARLVNWGLSLPPPARNVDYEKVIKKGLNGVLGEIREEMVKVRARLESTDGGGRGAPTIWEDWERYAFLKAGMVCCEAVITFAGRYAGLASEMAAKETDVNRKNELEKIAETCRWVPANPARTFHEAVQSFWLIHLASNLEVASDGETPGRLDQYLYPLYKKDIDEGMITCQEAGELLGCLWVKFNEMLCVKATANRQMHQASHFQDTTICGVTREGRDATNELTFLILEVTRQMKLPQPPLYLRYHKDIGEEVMLKAAEVNRDYGGGSPAFLNDAVTMLKLMERGVPLAEARDWIASGCVGAQIPHANPVPVGFYAHAAKAFELALYNGVDPKTGKQLGPATGSARDFTSFEQLYEAYLKQVKYETDLAQKGYKVGFAAYSEVYAMPFTYVLTDDCIKKYSRNNLGGARFPQIGIDRVERGYQNIGDSLTAVKKLVFEEKKISMAGLMDALEANFEGKENLRQMLLAAPKYGNDDDYADDVFDRMVLDVTRIGAEPRDIAGYPMMISRNGASGHFYVGMAMGALPDGRKAGEAIADAALSPVQGRDVKGPTAVILSATKINQLEYATSALMNMKIAPNSLHTREGLRKYIALIKTFFDRGGWHIQFNTISRQTLLDARKRPEQYKDLLVRVAGYSAFFVELSPEVQNEIISRTEHGL
jgi:pyruvate formate-lyase/glycerol dehydratase family glycyl radical enzyme